MQAKKKETMALSTSTKITAPQGKLISVIVPIYNVEAYLDQALKSVESQTYTNIEILCVNDGSTDASLQILEAHAKKNSRIKIINKENGGYGSACNAALNIAQGEWVGILEPDDYVLPNMFESMMNFLQGFEDAPAKANNFAKEGAPAVNAPTTNAPASEREGTSAAATTPIDIIKTPYWRICMPNTAEEQRLQCNYKGRIRPKTQPFTIEEAPHLLCHHPSIWSALYRRSFLTANNIRFKAIPGAGWADNPFLIETLCQAKHIIYLDEAFYCYRENTPEQDKKFMQTQTLVPFLRWHNMQDILDSLHIKDEGVLQSQIRKAFRYIASLERENLLPVQLSTTQTPDAPQAPGTQHASQSAGSQEPQQSNPNSQELYNLITRMFKRMNPEMVLNTNMVSPAHKAMFCRAQNIPAPKISKLPYTMYLIKEGLYYLKSFGPKNTLATIRSS